MSRQFSQFPGGNPPADTDRFLIGRVDGASPTGFSNFVMTWAQIKAAIGIVPVTGSSSSTGMLAPEEIYDEPLVIPGPPGVAGISGISGRDGNFVAGNDGDDGADGFTIIGPQGIQGQSEQLLFMEAEQPEDPLIAKGERGDRGFSGLNFVMMMLQDGEQEDIVPPVPSYNNAPISAVTTPAVPATTVAIKNNTGRDVTVYVKGGTLTVITVGGVVTGIAAAAAANTAHSIPLAMNQTIAITFTVAPTWVWVGS